MKNTQFAFDPETLPWIPLGPGESFKPLHFSARGRVLLLRLEPGTVVPRHRHRGEVHAFNISGSRELDTGEIVGPGGYVHEPIGNIDSWRAVGDEPCVVHIHSYGAMEYLDEYDNVLRSDDHATLREAYLRYCKEYGPHAARAWRVMAHTLHLKRATVDWKASSPLAARQGSGQTLPPQQ